VPRQKLAFAALVLAGFESWHRERARRIIAYALLLLLFVVFLGFYFGEKTT